MQECNERGSSIASDEVSGICRNQLRRCQAAFVECPVAIDFACKRLEWISFTQSPDQRQFSGRLTQKMSLPN